jgi:hypothetical protein
MRRASLIAVLSLSLVALAASPVSAAGPERSKFTGFVLDFPEGLVCDFAVRWDVFAGGNELVFPVRANGDQVVRQVGRNTATITNLGTGATVGIQGGTRQDFVFHADGTVDVIIDGHAIAGYFPADGGPSMWLFRGHLHDLVDGTFTLIAHDFSGNATDLCAALS